MSKNTETDVQATIAALTAKGRESMTAIGMRQVSFFDEGIAPGSGSWGSVLAGDLGHKSSGVLNRLRELGLFEATETGEESGAWWILTHLGASVANTLALDVLSEPEAPAPCKEHPAYDADYCPLCGTATVIGEQPVEAPSTAEEPVQADSPAEPEFAALATKDWRGNYNTVFAPAAEAIAAGAGVEVRTIVVSTMLKQTEIAGAKDFHALLVTVEEEALTALREWMKTVDRKDVSDMEKFNQNRSFLAGYLNAVAQRLTGSKKMPVLAFAKDMDKALRPDALKAGAAARKSA